jgi:hypothetical protein
VLPSCTDGVRDNDETDVDCGGGSFDGNPPCPPCADGKMCKVGTDCVDKVCGSDLTCSAPTCTDGLENGAETDVDCGGGTCPTCATGLRCTADADCTSNACDASSSLCVASQCSDHRKDGREADVDCGGGVCPTCPNGKGCENNLDCTSGACDYAAVLCVPNPCLDHHQDYTESDVDCGGVCPGCPVGKMCNSTSDCQVGHTCTTTIPHVCG